MLGDTATGAADLLGPVLGLLDLLAGGLHLVLYFQSNSWEARWRGRDEMQACGYGAFVVDAQVGQIEWKGGFGYFEWRACRERGASQNFA